MPRWLDPRIRTNKEIALHCQLGVLHHLQGVFVLLQRRLNLGSDKALHNLRRPTGERRRVNESRKLWKYRFEEFTTLYTLEEIVRLAFLLYHGGGFVRQNPGYLLASRYVQFTGSTYRISSCASCLENLRSTIAMMMFSVAMNGSSWSMRCLMMALLTTIPDDTLLSFRSS